ncbi:phage terminase large subunit [Aestuariicoccus sp. MJ-SS9]|uniref:phage terminase large subunit n=1 Tax=Aestuariicoccus sp. MJ-SS9 TaxID=3079855 RepID=UPI00291429E9|nr:phage terminase large subunit [Aestuariicoccus sp. MJ-SS9]MDU8912507.1 phage terminase large subunit [Aestuariicoccus sp. MJ-SS9]
MTDRTPREQFAVSMAALLRNNLHAYVHRAFLELHPGTAFLTAFYIRAICYELERVARGEVRRLLIILPPRHLKSHCASVAFSIWFLARNPSMTVVGASYNADLAQTFSAQARRLLEAPWHSAAFPQLQLDPRKASAEELRIRHFGGRRIATSVGGTFTGKGSNLTIIDDPLKADDAFSEARRDDVYDWITSTVISRFDDPKRGALVVVAQRLHIDDLAGRLMETGDWHVLQLPAIAPVSQAIDIGEGLIWNRERGELLHPERIDEATLEQIRKELGTAAFEAQYQQQPAPAEGHIIRPEWFGSYPKALPRKQYEAVVQSWDVAVVPGNSNSFTVCTTWGLIEDKIDLIDVTRVRLEMPDIERLAHKLYLSWRPNLVVIEASHTGVGLYQYLRQRGICEARTSTPKGSKEERMSVLTPMLESGQVRLPTAALWLEAFLEECGQFPLGKFDDQVDTLSQMLRVVRKGTHELRHCTRYKTK